MRVVVFTAILATVQLSGCADFPDLKSEVSPEAVDAPYPALWPHQDLETYADGGTGNNAGSLDARAAKLRSAADQLSGPVIDKETREFLTESMQKSEG